MNWIGLKFLTNNFDRLIFDSLMVVAVYFLPTNLFALIAVIGIIVFHYYYEASFIFFGWELVFGFPYPGWSPYYFLGTIIMLLLIVVVEEIKIRVIV